jgi:hypothetical protein
LTLHPKGASGRANLTEKQSRSTFSEPGYGHQVWGSSNNRFDLATILPPVLLVGLLLLLLPLCAGLLAPMFSGQSPMTPYPYPHGRKRRHALDDHLFGFEDWPYFGLTHHLIRPILDTLHKSLLKYAK